MSYVLINHGWSNTRQDGHWQRHLALALRLAGHDVSYAQYPQTETPFFDDWSALLVHELKLLHELRDARGDNGEMVVIGHSLGSLNIMKSALEGRIPAELRANRLLLVAPSGQDMLEDITETFAFDPVELAASNALNRVAEKVTILASDEDFWLPQGIRASYTDALGIEPVIMPGAKHFAPGDGYGPWQGVLDWVLDPAADLGAR
ncbi:MAG TPA: alpha/beta hydrolase [Microbacteriaceae bacterium]|nr:alpha/beta hydrolase [Microbacteriaceae bacterium]